MVITLNLKNIVNSIATRYYTYDWLRHMFLKEPSMEIIEELIKMAKNYEYIEETSIETDLIIYFKSLKDKDLEYLNTELKAEFARLFLGQNKLLAPPFESVYRSPRKRLLGEETMEVRKLYKEMGMEVLDFGSLPDDHIGLELEYMYYLSFKVLDLIEDEGEIKDIINLLEKQQKFIKEHLTMWVPEFCKDIKENTNLLFFKEIAKFTEKFIFEEKDIINITLESLKKLA